jgi:squalene-hopene/tetraprenyl-beta-curcumene cyclase
MAQQAETRFKSLSAQVRQDDLESRLERALHQATRYLLCRQNAEGYWVGELEADTTLESDYIFFLHVTGKFDSYRVAKLANYIRRKQLPDGGWNIHEGGPCELNATVKAYLALKLAGDPPEASHMERARRCVRRLGGLERTNSYTRFYLAVGGAVGWDMVPGVPPELMLLPTWCPMGIYSFSSWTRAIVVPLMIVYALKPRWPVPQHAHVDELFCDQARRYSVFAWDDKLLTWRNLFLVLERLFKVYEALPWRPFRQRALARARRWLLEHLERSHGLGAIYPAMMNSILALLALGYPADDPLTAREIAHLARLEIAENNTLRLQPCLSPVWDTALAMVALQEAGLPASHPALAQAARWLLDQQVLGPGDWQVQNPDAEPGGWAFEFRNDFFPDVDDTAVVLVALQRAELPESTRQQLAIERGLNWVLSMQNRDGGWGAFDRNNDCRVLTRVPFADHNAMIDPSTADLTARALECLGHLARPASDPVVQKALAYLRREQTREGAWYGRWGVNYIYGTSGVLRALGALGLANQDCAQRAAAWLRSVQNPDGGFGESCASYNAPVLRGQGASTPSQTAWGLIGLLAAGVEVADPAVTLAVRYLVDRQEAAGSWEEQAFTGTGFPSVFYLRYHLYRHYFPLYALARYRHLLRGVKAHTAVHLGVQAA